VRGVPSPSVVSSFSLSVRVRPEFCARAASFGSGWDGMGWDGVYARALCAGLKRGTVAVANLGRPQRDQDCKWPGFCDRSSKLKGWSVEVGLRLFVDLVRVLRVEKAGAFAAKPITWWRTWAKGRCRRTCCCSLLLLCFWEGVSRPLPQSLKKRSGTPLSSPLNPYSVPRACSALSAR